MARNKWQDWADRYHRLKSEMDEMQKRGPVEDETVEYLLTSAEMLAGAARTIIDMKLKPKDATAHEG